jgi:hypothetical protein
VSVGLVMSVGFLDGQCWRFGHSAVDIVISLETVIESASY